MPFCFASRGWRPSKVRPSRRRVRPRSPRPRIHAPPRLEEGGPPQAEVRRQQAEARQQQAEAPPRLESVCWPGRTRVTAEPSTSTCPLPGIHRNQDYDWVCNRQTTLQPCRPVTYRTFQRTTPCAIVSVSSCFISFAFPTVLSDLYHAMTWPSLSYVAEDAKGRIVGYVLAKMWVRHISVFFSRI